jgi:hypothetical protein
VLKVLYSIVLLFSINSYANDNEIDHLIEFVSLTSCSYERNGDLHTGPEAAKHIQKKYQYYKDDINSTEDFIEYAATKSGISGDVYRVICPNQETLDSKTWLTNELMEFRRKH